MRTSTLVVALVSALLLVSAGTAGAITATGPLHQQQSPTGTPTGGSGTGIDVGTTTTTPTAPSGPSVTFNDQNSTGETVLIQSATLPKNGFVVIYDPSRGGNTANQIIGASYLLNAGTSNNIRIQLDKPLNQTTSLTAIVHVDSNNNGQFDYVASNGKQDPPLKQGGGKIVDIATVTVQSAASGGTSQTATGGTTTASGGDGASGGDSGTQTTSGGAGDGGTTADGANESGGSGGSGGSGAFGPGFGLVIAVVALLAVALLAVRRN